MKSAPPGFSVSASLLLDFLMWIGQQLALQYPFWSRSKKVVLLLILFSSIRRGNML